MDLVLQAHQHHLLGRHVAEGAALDDLGAGDGLDDLAEGRDARLDLALRGVADADLGVDDDRVQDGRGLVERLGGGCLLVAHRSASAMAASRSSRLWLAGTPSSFARACRSRYDTPSSLAPSGAGGVGSRSVAGVDGSPLPGAWRRSATVWAGTRR